MMGKKKRSTGSTDSVDGSAFSGGEGGGEDMS